GPSRSRPDLRRSRRVRQRLRLRGILDHRRRGDGIGDACDRNQPRGLRRDRRRRGTTHRRAVGRRAEGRARRRAFRSGAPLVDAGPRPRARPALPLGGQRAPHARDPAGGSGVSTSTALPTVVRRDLDEICERASSALARLAGATVLVSGGEGFLPSYLVDALLHANDQGLAPACRVLFVDNRATAAPARLAGRAGRGDFLLLEHDITAPLDLSEPVDYVVHGASIASPTWYRARPLETIDVNVGGTRRLLDIARERQVKSFLYL